MNNQVTPRLLQGIGMLALSAILLLIALNWFWDGIQKWMAISALNQTSRHEFLDRAPQARQTANRAARYQKDAATALANFDPTATDAAARINQIAARVRNNRALVRNMQDYVNILDGEQVNPAGHGPNVALLQALVQYREHQRGSVPPLPTSQSGPAPDRNLLQRALEWRLAAAWRSGDGDAAAESAAQLAFLFPKHPAAPYARLFNQAIIEGVEDGQLRRAMGRGSEISSDVAITAALRAGARQAPENVLTILPLIPSSKRSGAERLTALILNEETAERVTEEAERQGGDQILGVAATYVLARNRVDLARRLAAAGSERFERRLTAVIARRELDFATLKELGVAIEDIQPQPMLIHHGSDWISFHLSDSHGNIPMASNLEVRLNGTPVDRETMIRVGSMHWVPAPGGNRLNLELRIDDQPVAIQEVWR